MTAYVGGVRGPPVQGSATVVSRTRAMSRQSMMRVGLISAATGRTARPTHGAVSRNDSFVVRSQGAGFTIELRGDYRAKGCRSAQLT